MSVQRVPICQDSEPLQRQTQDKVGHKNNNTSKYFFNKLTFTNVSMDNTGQYTCIVTNHVGQQNNETIEVNVIEGDLFKWRQKMGMSS